MSHHKVDPLHTFQVKAMHSLRAWLFETAIIGADKINHHVAKAFQSI
jgi:hypothetical protein